MGQYYVPLLESESGKVKTLYSHDFDNGLKLMEHSYIGNRFVNAVLVLLNHPHRVAWIGDYSCDPYVDLYAEALPRDEFQAYYNKAWGDDQDTYKLPASAFETQTLESVLSHDPVAKYLTNHTKRQFIDLKRYIAQNSYDGGWCINPLPLLTACGNDRGGGDYDRQYPDYDKVGLWAFDIIQFGDEHPADYEEVTFYFKEA